METTVQSSCVTCDFRPDRFFCDMPAESLKAFDKIKSLALCRRNTVLFAEGRSGPRHLHPVRWSRQALHLFRHRKTPDPADCRSGRSSGTGRCPFQYSLRDHGGAAGQLPGRLRPQKRLTEVPARAHRGLPAGRAHAEPGPARRLRTCAQHRQHTRPPAAHCFPPARHGGLKTGDIRSSARDASRGFLIRIPFRSTWHKQAVHNSRLIVVSY